MGLAVDDTTVGVLHWLDGSNLLCNQCNLYGTKGCHYTSEDCTQRPSPCSQRLACTLCRVCNCHDHLVPQFHLPCSSLLLCLLVLQGLFLVGKFPFLCKSLCIEQLLVSQLLLCGFHVVVTAVTKALVQVLYLVGTFVDLVQCLVMKLLHLFKPLCRLLYCKVHEHRERVHCWCQERVVNLLEELVELSKTLLH